MTNFCFERLGRIGQPKSNEVSQRKEIKQLLKGIRREVRQHGELRGLISFMIRLNVLSDLSDTFFCAKLLQAGQEAGLFSTLDIEKMGASEAHAFLASLKEVYKIAVDADADWSFDSPYLILNGRSMPQSADPTLYETIPSASCREYWKYLTTRKYSVFWYGNRFTPEQLVWLRYYFALDKEQRSVDITAELSDLLFKHPEEIGPLLLLALRNVAAKETAE